MPPARGFMLPITPSPLSHRWAAEWIVVLCIIGISMASSTAAEDIAFTAPPDWPRIADTLHERLIQLASDQAAIELFVGSVGNQVSLNDVAATLGAKATIPAKLARELLLPEITQSARRLVAGLAAWHLAERAMRSLAEHPATVLPAVSPSQAAWLMDNGPFPSLGEALADPGEGGTSTALAAGRLAQDAGQQVMTEWWRLKTWKDRIRVARGQSRLCGTWQWVIHNHQRHHEEQKLSLTFPPQPTSGTGIPGLAEIVVLGDIVYLRWERDGKTQEDSLLLSKEGQRLEGTFVNSQGGWGSISGKRTASCTLS